MKFVIEFDMYIKGNVGFNCKVEFVFIKGYFGFFIENFCYIFIEVIIFFLIFFDNKLVNYVL